MKLEGKVAVVTGAGRGIGRAIAGVLAREGARMVVVARTRREIEAAAGELRELGAEALAVAADVADADEVAELRRRVLDECGRVDVLVNNAGTSYIASVLKSDDDEWWRVVEVNLRSCYLCSKAFVRPMIRQKGGRIVNISSIAAKIGGAWNSAYAASKAAVLGLTRSLALEVAASGITVNAICPGYVETQLAEYTMGARGKIFGKSAEEYLADLEAEIPMKRHVTAEEVAAAVSFLVSPEAGAITGQAVNVDGGRVTGV